jgi:hypothetical protein
LRATISVAFRGGPLPDRYLEVPPDLVVEVLSPNDRWPKVLAKAAEYLDAGTAFLLVLDDEGRLAHLYGADGTSSSSAASFGHTTRVEASKPGASPAWSGRISGAYKAPPRARAPRTPLMFTHGWYANPFTNTPT